MTKTVIAFSGKRGSGKSTASRVLIDHMGFVEIKFADPLKNMLRCMYATCGVSYDTIERKIEGDLKEEPCEWLMGQTPRHAMQTLGTEWRDLINTDLWSSMFIRRIESSPHNKFVCSDYRFPHETVVLRKLGATIYKIERPTKAKDDTAAKHISETAIDTLPFDVSIMNTGTIEELQKNVHNLVSENVQDN